MPQAPLRFYEELNDFLAVSLCKTDNTHAFGTLDKDMIESLGVSHTEPEIVLVNDSPRNSTATTVMIIER